MELNIKGVKLPVDVTDDGTFRVIMGSESYHADTLRGLREKVSRAMRQRDLAVAVEFTTEGLLDATATGLHARSGKVLMRFADGTAGQLDSWVKTYRRLTSEEKAEAKRLADAARAARHALEQFSATHILDVRKAVQQALDEAMSKENG